MRTRLIELAGEAAEADRDVDVLSVYTASAWMAVAAGAFGALMAVVEDLRPRRRALGAGAALATSAFGVAALVRPVEVTALLRRRLSPWALPLLGLTGIVASGADRSPMFYPGLILTGLGGGRLGGARARLREPSSTSLLGLTIACLYLAGAARAHRRCASGSARGLLWNAGAAPLFFAAAAVGGELGDVAVVARRVERARTRDRRTLDAAGARDRASLRYVAAQVRETAAELEQTLLRIGAEQRARRGPAASDVQRAVEAVCGDIRYHQLGPLLIAAANGEPLDLELTLQEALDVYRAGWSRQGVAIELRSRLRAGYRLDARTTCALVGAAKVALDNAHRHRRRPLTAVAVELRLSGDRVRLTVTDDGGAADAPPPQQWGTGLTETLADVRGVGGRLQLCPGERGLCLRVEVPEHARGGPAGEPPASLDGRIGQALGRCGRMLRPAAWLNGVSCCLTARSRRAGAADAALFTALVLADRAWRLQAPRDRRRAAAIVPAVSLLWPAGGLPPTGWSGLEAIAKGARGEGGQALALGALAFAAAAVAGLRVRRSLDRARLLENVSFPLVCAASGVAVAHGRRLLRQAERDSLGLRERADLIERLGRAVRLHHELIKPLRNTPGWYDDDIVEGEDGQRLLELSERIAELTPRLLALIGEADPARELCEQLQLRLQPTAVSVSGVRPVWTSERAREAGVERAREHLAVVALADDLADWLLARYPPRLDGSPRLERLRLLLEPLDEQRVLISVQVEGARDGRRASTRALEGALARIAGRIEPAAGSAAVAFAVPATALAIA